MSPPLALWLTGGSQPGPTVGGFLFVTLASLAAGMAISAVRWSVLDTCHHWTGLRRPPWDDSLLDRKLAAFDYLVEHHYRYYQFYGNSFLAIFFAYILWRFAPQLGQTGGYAAYDITVGLLLCVFVAASRDALRNYYRRASHLLAAKESEVNSDQRKRPRPRSRAAADSAQSSKDATPQAEQGSAPGEDSGKAERPVES